MVLVFQDVWFLVRCFSINFLIQNYIIQSGETRAKPPFYNGAQITMIIVKVRF